MRGLRSAMGRLWIRTEEPSSEVLIAHVLCLSEKPAEGEARRCPSTQHVRPCAQDQRSASASLPRYVQSPSLI